MVEAFRQRSSLQPTEAITIHHKELKGWIAPEKIGGGKFEARFYVTDDGNLKWLLLEADATAGYGLLTYLPIKFEDIESLAADSSICSPPKDDKKVTLVSPSEGVDFSK